MFRVLYCALLIAYELKDVAADASPTTATTPAPPDFEDDEWHMDFMPTGYLPDSVYRELAWYGILQLQPLHHSTKHLSVAQLIWQHTLGRPHVIMENPPQSAQSPQKINRQVIAEEATKWSREQRTIQEVIMENIKSGMTGVTVRTVISEKTVTNYLIMEGKIYECPPGAAADFEDFRDPSYLRQMTPDKLCVVQSTGSSVAGTPVAYDPCIEGETAPLEYSMGKKPGWYFCFGDGMRDTNYKSDGELDCGTKKMVAVATFLGTCAIDNNIVITFDYFASEPRKEILHNSTLCTTWDPCHLSYLYRLEPPEDMPQVPSTPNTNPCDVTVCEECKEGGTPDPGQFPTTPTPVGGPSGGGGAGGVPPPEPPPG